MLDELEITNALFQLYFWFEAIQLIACTKALFTKQMAHRIIHGQFVNAEDLEIITYMI